MSVTMFTIGYGDIAPQSIKKMIRQFRVLYSNCFYHSELLLAVVYCVHSWINPQWMAEVVKAVGSELASH